jgi:hypothetical protein
MKGIVQELKDINEYEAGLRRVELSRNSDFNVDIDGRIRFCVDGKVYSAAQDRPIIHQLGSRLWNEIEAYSEVGRQWKAAVNRDKENLADRIADRLRDTASILLLDENARSVYGIISDSFTHIDPIKFRTRFMEAYRSIGSPVKYKRKMAKTPFGEVIETFSFKDRALDDNNEPVDFSVNVIYGRNNGYSSFRVSLGRMIVICENGLKQFEGISSRLKHTSDADIGAFVDEIRANVLRYSRHLQVVIDRAKSSGTSISQLYELFQRLHVAVVVKNRIKERLGSETSLHGRNEWALCQAFTYLATHFYNAGNDRHHERILETVGSDILDKGVQPVLDEEVGIIDTGRLKTFGNLLPRGLMESAPKCPARAVAPTEPAPTSDMPTPENDEIDQLFYSFRRKVSGRFDRSR